MKNMRILIPISLPLTSIDALALAKKMSQEGPISVTLLNIIALNIVSDARLYRDLSLENENALREIGLRFFAGESDVKARVRIGRPSEQIAGEAKSDQTDLIIMPGPSQDRPQRWFCEGTVKGVVRLAPCPTLVLPRLLNCEPEKSRGVARPAQESAGHWVAPAPA
jgi:nucleotide-binding universal stress UspA family protein